MTIARSDVKLMKSERLTDNDDGGGRMTGVEVVDGVANNLFPDISRLDRVYGRVSMRKAFLSVNTANSDVYYGAHAIVSNPPADNQVNTLLFTTYSPSDTRSQSQSRVESYMVKSYATGMKLLGNHLAGQLSATVFQDVKLEIPAIGDVIVLSYQGQEQFLRVIDLTYTSHIFQYEASPGSGNMLSYTAYRIVLNFNQLLAYDFKGNDPNPAKAAETLIYNTSIANASKYYGVDTLAEDAVLGRKDLAVKSIFKPIVPATNKESIILDNHPFVNADNMMALGADLSATSPAWGTSLTAGRYYYMGVGILPGSLSITFGTTQYEDKGGFIVPSTSSLDVGVQGTVDYPTGKIYLAGGGSGVVVTATATPAANISGEKVTGFKQVTVTDLAFNWVFSAMSMDTGYLPAVGTVTVDYMSFGKWYRLYDNCNGGLEGKESGVGVGQVDYATGSLSLTCASLPDIGSYIIVSYSPKESVAALAVPNYTFQGFDINFNEDYIKYGTVTLSWKKADGTAMTVTDNGAGLFTGANASGDIAYGKTQYRDANGTLTDVKPHLRFKPLTIPNTITPLTITYNEGEPSSSFNMEFTPPAANGPLTFDTGKVNIVPGTVRILMRYLLCGVRTWVTMTDDGVGGLIKAYSTAGLVGAAAYTNQPMTGASINYTTGVIYFTSPQFLGQVRVLSTTSYVARNTPSVGFLGTVWASSGGSTSVGRVVASGFGFNGGYSWEYIPVTSYFNVYDYCYFDGVAFVSGSTVGATGVQHTISMAWPAPKLWLTTLIEEIIPGSVRFQIGANNYIDIAGGNIQKSINGTTGVGTTVGTIDYMDGTISLNSFSEFTGPTIPDPVGISIISKDRLKVPTKMLVWRTAGAPLVPGSVVLSARDYMTGTNLGLAISDQGIISSTFDPLLGGKVHYDTGIIALVCGTASTLYSPDVTYSAVYRQNVPLDATLIGLDPTRLPLDGRVPFIRKADVIVVHNTDTYQVPQPAIGTTVNVGRTQLALVEVIDAVDVVVSEADYTVNLAAGTVTFDPTFSLAYTEPLRVIHRIEDMLLATEVYITGRIETAGSLSHNYPKDTTQVSSALLFGDLASRVSNLFSNNTWTSIYSDTPGSPTSAKYNDLQYPIQVKNSEAIQERWAIIFTSATAFTVNGEGLGQIAIGNTSTNCVPLNSLTGLPYFTIPYLAWGTGWATGNVLRFNTQAASAPLWLLRTTLAGPVIEPVDKFILQLRGDAN